MWGRSSPKTPKAEPKPQASPQKAGLPNVDAQVDELQALVAQSREEQAVISSKILALKSGGSAAGAKGGSGGFGAPGAAGDEVRALREQLAETDSMLLEKDAEVENLRQTVKALMVQVEEPKTGAAWRQRYEAAQKQLEALRKDYEGTQVELGQKQREMANLASYLRILEVSGQTNESQRERLLQDTGKATEKVRILQVERDSLARQQRTLEEGFLRCVGRVTSSLAAGVATVIISDLKNKRDTQAKACFVVIRAGTDGGGVLEIFSEPDAHDDQLSVDLSTSAKATVNADNENLTILMNGNSGDSEVRLCCSQMEEFMKWSGALRLVGFDNI